MPWYFAYGSNMQSATLRGRRGVQYRRACAANLAGWRLVLDKPPLVPIGEAFANIIEDESSQVLGVAFEVSDDDRAHIELTEGVKIGNYETAWVRVQLFEPVESENPEELQVEAFTLTSNRRDLELRPSARYMGLLIEGAREHGLPDEYIAYLEAIPTGPESKLASAFRPVMDRFMRGGRRGE